MEGGSQAPRIVVKRYFEEVLNGRNVAAIDELIADEVLKQRVAAFSSAFPDLAVEPRQTLAHEALVAVHLFGAERTKDCSRAVPPRAGAGRRRGR